eukprot:5292619-Pyramimonas_sp.AAC.1
MLSRIIAWRQGDSRHGAGQGHGRISARELELDSCHVMSSAPGAKVTTRGHCEELSPRDAERWPEFVACAN